MKTITFKYTKKDGSVSERTLLAMVTPGDKYAGIDVSELDPYMAGKFMEEAEAAHLDYISKLTQLQAKYDIVHAYRQFLVSGVSELSEI
jgi:hypothetical protein